MRARLQQERRTRELALLNLGIDSKLRGCDLVALRVRDLQQRPAPALAPTRRRLAHLPQQLGLLSAWDVMMRITHNFHLFVGGIYAAGLYSYLWSDVMAADAVNVFENAPGGIYAAEVAPAWIDKILGVGHRVRADAAFRDFAGHDRDPGPLHRRFGLAASA